MRSFAPLRMTSFLQPTFLEHARSVSVKIQRDDSASRWTHVLFLWCVLIPSSGGGLPILRTI